MRAVNHLERKVVVTCPHATLASNPDPHILAAEIAEDLESALDQIRVIVNDLEERL